MNTKIITVYLLLIYIILFPTFIGGIGLFLGQRILYISYPLILVSIALLYKINKIKLNSLSCLIFFIFILQMVSILSKISFIEIQMIFSHSRYLIYFIIFTITYSLSQKIKMDIGQLYNLIITMSILLIIFMIIHALFPSLIFELGLTNRPFLGWIGFNVGGPFIWSYSYTFITTLPIFILLSLYTKGKLSKKNLLLLLVISFTIVISQSKAAYLSYFLLTILVIAISFKFGKNKKTLILILYASVFITLSIFYIYNNLDSLGNISRFLDGFNDNTLDQSTQTRINQLSNIKMTIENNIVFGYPLNTIVIENAFGYYFYNYGLIGIISYIILLLTLCIKAWNIVIYENKYSNNPYSQSIAIGFLCFYISTIIFSLGSSPIDGHKISYYFWTITGLFLGTMKINESRD